MDFHNSNNSKTYATREADVSWYEAMQAILPLHDISTALDIGCGGGIYTKALADMGIKTVIGVDFSETILHGARENGLNYQNIDFVKGNALDTKIQANSYDLLLERALIHHIDDLPSCFAEAYRLLRNNGTFVIQDRTPEDCLLEGNEHHIRGFFFEAYPELGEKEKKRRHNNDYVIDRLKTAGFKSIEVVKLWETRAAYSNKQSLLEDLRKRTGRSILHELTEKELAKLVQCIDQALPENTNIVEKDRWTIWKAKK